MAYIPKPVSVSDDLLRYLEQELREISGELSLPEFQGVTLTVLYAEPERYFPGLIVYADGTTWNPGSGEGVYVRTSSAWSKL